MAHRAYELVIEWDANGLQSHAGRSYNDLYSLLEFLNTNRFRQYVPCLGSQHSDFLTRLSTWLDNVQSSDDKRTLMEVVPELLFFGREEFTKLHQAALSGPVTRWIIDLLDLRFDDPNLQATLHKETHFHTWYCPVSDSMPIGDFYHVNNLGGIDHRPDFRSLHKFGDIGRVRDYMTHHENARGEPSPLNRIVLLEDFVGGGTQLEAVEFASGLSPDLPVLFVPMIICPRGVEKTRALMGRYGNLRYCPLIELSSDLFVNRNECLGNTALGQAIRQLAETTYTHVVGDNSSKPLPYTLFGFRETGALVVMYSNTPANTLALVHHESNTWRALFPRSARIR